MNNIIQHICIQFIIEVMEFFSEGKAKNLTEMECGLKEKSDKFLKKVIKAYLEEIDRQIAEDKKGRKEKGLVVERKNDARRIYTKFGELIYSRSYYFNKQEKTYLYPVDQVVGLEPYERVSQAVAADLVGHAAEVSYAKSSRYVTGGEISRQTVMNKIRKTHGLKIPAPEEKRTVKTLYVDADEDHIALQDGSNTIVPIITVHEGTQKLYKSRNQCINPHHICSYEKEPEDLWLEAAEWIYDTYDVDNLETIYIHGDGASWIKKGLEILPKSKLVLDKYHLNKAVMNCTGAQPEYRSALWSALKEADWDEVKKNIHSMKEKAQSENELKRIKEFRRYILNNWQGIKIHKTKACGGSSAEAHVSHVLSARMSSRPMGWSREGVKHMTKLRTFCINGGIVKPWHLKPKIKVDGLVNKAMKKAQKAFESPSMETLENIPAKKIGKVTPIFKTIRAVERMGFIT